MDTPAALIALAAVTGGALLLMRAMHDPEDQTADPLDSLGVMLDPTTYTPADVAPDEADMNIKAFLDMIAASEGTAGRGDNGYNILVGGGTFDSYDDHPRRVIQVRAGLASSAAGRYQFLARTWDSLAARLSLPDFSPQSQDTAAIELIRERGALNDVKAGRVEVAIQKVARIWASLPGAGYNQPERRLSYLIAAYQNAGGTLA